MATKQQIPVLAARLVEFQEEFSILPTRDAQWAIMHAKEAVALCAKAIINRQKLPARLISDGHTLALKASDGTRLIYQATNVFKFINDAFAKLVINKRGIATPKMFVQVHEASEDGNVMEIFRALPGSWNQKWLPQDKVVDFCVTFPQWLHQEGLGTLFLIKKDEHQPIDETRPEDNLVVVDVYIDSDNSLGVNLYRLEDAYVASGEEHHRIVSPQLMSKEIIRLISSGHDLKLKASDGSRLICQSKDTFKAYIDPDFVNWGMNKPGIASAEISVQVHEMIEDGAFMDIFQALPGNWEEKWLPQDKVADFCDTFPNWLRQEGFATFFLVKKDENRPIDEKKPGDNLVVVGVDVYDDGLYVSVNRLEYANIWDGAFRHLIVSPQLMPLEE